jgi:HEAT repeat protein
MPASPANTRRNRALLVIALGAGLGPSSGCHDGPMYALKQANPFYVNQWRADERLGPTDATRAAELQTLVAQIGAMPQAEQDRWIGELEKVMQYDKSPYMRELSIRAAGNAGTPKALAIIRTGLEDDDAKVRIFSASALASRREPEAIELLAKTVSDESNKDVRLEAIKSLGTHRGPRVVDALRLALEEPDLAYRHTAIVALRKSTGKDAGDDPAAWIAMLDSPDAPPTMEQPESESIARRIGNWFQR